MDNPVLQRLLSGRKYLLLQGPMGPFFAKLAEWLQEHGREVQQVCFNAGDRFYSSQSHSLDYKGSRSEFASWLKEFYQHSPFDTIVCFGDCRPLHHIAKRWAAMRGIRFLVFEDGYLRPHFITLEEGGVNAHSSLPRQPNYYLQQEIPELPQVKSFKPSFTKRAWHATVYYLAGWAGKKKFPNYQHHKTFSPWSETFYWLRAARRKWHYRWQQRPIKARLQSELSNRYFLAILQVYNDSQLRTHSPYQDMRDYIHQVISSFAKNANREHFLVLKHHPMDRGHRHYGKLIDTLAKKYGIGERVVYIHDVSMPLLLTHTLAVVTINSTAGLSALHHGKPLKVMGNAHYDIRGITFSGSLHKFWNTSFQPDRELFDRFRAHLRHQTQINAVYYGDMRWITQQTPKQQERLADKNSQPDLLEPPA